jgi:hypothetical protein
LSSTELAGGWHLHPLVVAEYLEEAAFRGVVRIDQRPGFAATQEAFGGRKVQLRGLQLGVVADLAVRGEDGTNLLLEELRLLLALCQQWSGEAGNRKG